MNQQTEGLPKPLTQSPLGPSRSTNQPRNPVSWVQDFRFLRRPTMCPRKSHPTWSSTFTFWKEAVRIDAWLSDRVPPSPRGLQSSRRGEGSRGEGQGALGPCTCLGISHSLYFSCQGSKLIPLEEDSCCLEEVWRRSL